LPSGFVLGSQRANSFDGSPPHRRVCPHFSPSDGRCWLCCLCGGRQACREVGCYLLIGRGCCCCLWLVVVFASDHSSDVSASQKSIL
jgi:hypothetical protein